jgi:3-mercaptopyruvate sulfurtransferase SseA
VLVRRAAGPRVAAAAFTRLGYRDVRVYDGGKTDWAAAGLPFEGDRTAAEVVR